MSEHPGFTRRQVLAHAAAAGVCSAWPLLAADPKPDAAPRPPSGSRVWDVHVHMVGVEGTTPEQRIARLLTYADRVGIDRLILFLGLSLRAYDPTPDVVRIHNDEVLRALEAGRGRVFGFVYLNPKYPDESLRELDRCVASGPMLGIKLWVALECNDPRLDPICRRAVELKAILLQHTYWRTEANLPGESNPLHVAELARRHPELPIIAAHTGNDWERGIRAIRATKNVFCEVSGFDTTAGVVEMAVRELGAERILYGSDAGGRSFASQMGKVLAADIPEADKRLIFGGNIERVLAPILAQKGIRL